MKIIAAIPSLKERTAELCVDLISKQVQEVRVIEGLGRWEAIYKCWEVGLDADILVLLPTDMLVYPGIIDKMISKLGSFDRLSAKCHSKFRGMGSGGVSIYNSRCLPKLMKLSKEKYQDSLRPESNPVVKHLQYYVDSLPTGLHEYELDYKEIYDRYLFQKIKHTGQIKMLRDEFVRLAKFDKDYKAVLQAIDGVKFSMGNKPPLDKKETIKRYRL